ncbi:hypothetical protein [Paenibacillus ferrarius]
MKSPIPTAPACHLQKVQEILLFKPDSHAILQKVHQISVIS